MISNKKKAVIHIAKAQVGMSDEEYRDLLSSVGVESSKDLTGNTFGKIMDHFEKLGFKTKAKTRKRKINNLPVDKKALMEKLEAILLDLDLSWGYVDSIAASRFGVDRAQWLEGEPLYKLVQIMAVHQKRQRRKNA